MAAIAAYAARHAGSRPADEFAPVELGFELNLSPQSAAEQMHYASAVAGRLPAPSPRCSPGRFHPVDLRIIEEETSVLSDEDAARADQVLAGAAPGLTFGEVRRAAHKLVLKLDPEAAKKRKEAARGEAHVRRFREASGNAGMVARELPSMRSWPPGSTSSSGPWTCARPGCPAPCRSCACAPIWICCRSVTAATCPPAARPASRTSRHRTASPPAA